MVISSLATFLQRGAVRPRVARVSAAPFTRPSTSYLRALMSISMQHDRGDGLVLHGHRPVDDGSLPPSKRPRLPNPPITEPNNGVDLFNLLPDECIFEIFKFLPSYRDRCSCAAVSKKWLILQAKMRASEFKSIIPSQQPFNYGISRCLEGKKANDTRLVAMAVGICPAGGLTELCIRGSFPSQGITDFGLKIISQACPNLKTLTLWDCPTVGNAAFESIARGCNLLEKLDILHLKLVDDKGLIAIANNCPNLLMLNLDSCPLISNESLYAFAMCSSKLHTISLIKCPLVGSEGIISVVSSLPKLSKLKLVSASAKDSTLEAIGRHGGSLRNLWLENISDISETGFCSVARLEKVEFLSMNSCSGLKDLSLKAIGNQFAGLKVISIRNCKQLTDRGLKLLTESAAMLEKLKLVECNNVTSKGLMEIFVNCSNRLKVLSLVNCRGIAEADPSNSRIVPLPKCHFLESLTLKRCTEVGDSLLAWIGSTCGQVKHLKLVGLTSITDRGVMYLLKGFDTQNKALVSVNLSECSRLTDWSVLAITSAFGEKLKSLKLDGCDGLSDRSLEMIGGLCPFLLKLDLSRCGISDNGVFCLAKSKHQCIEVLSLAGCMRITDDSLGFIQVMCGSLVGLNVKQCSRLTKRGIESVRKTLWWCDLLY